MTFEEWFTTLTTNDIYDYFPGRMMLTKSPHELLAKAWQARDELAKEEIKAAVEAEREFILSKLKPEYEDWRLEQAYYEAIRARGNSA